MQIAQTSWRLRFVGSRSRSKFSPLTTYQTVMSYSTLVQARKLILSMYFHVGEASIFEAWALHLSFGSY